LKQVQQQINQRGINYMDDSRLCKLFRSDRESEDTFEPCLYKDMSVKLLENILGLGFYFTQGSEWSLDHYDSLQHDTHLPID